MKLDRLLKSSIPHLADVISIKSSRVPQMEAVLASLPVALRALLWMLLYLNYGIFRVCVPLLGCLSICGTVAAWGGQASVSEN